MKVATKHYYRLLNCLCCNAIQHSHWLCNRVGQTSEHCIWRLTKCLRNTPAECKFVVVVFVTHVSEWSRYLFSHPFLWWLWLIDLLTLYSVDMPRNVLGQKNPMWHLAVCASVRETIQLGVYMKLLGGFDKYKIHERVHVCALPVCAVRKTKKCGTWQTEHTELNWFSCRCYEMLRP